MHPKAKANLTPDLRQLLLTLAIHQSRCAYIIANKTPGTSGSSTAYHYATGINTEHIQPALAKHGRYQEKTH